MIQTFAKKNFCNILKDSDVPSRPPANIIEIPMTPKRIELIMNTRVAIFCMASIIADRDYCVQYLNQMRQLLDTPEWVA